MDGIEENVVKNEVQETSNKKEENENIIVVPLKSPIELDGALLNSITLDFTNMTGQDVINVDEELRREGHNMGFDNVFNHNALLKLASKAARKIPDDLKKLHAGDYMEVAFKTRNFFIQW